jgi:hypothetical protein
MGAQEGPTIYLYVGIFLLACFASLHYYLYLRLRDTGYKKSIFNFLLVDVPVDYLKNQSQVRVVGVACLLSLARPHRWPRALGGWSVQTIRGVSVKRRHRGLSRDD